MDPPLLIAVLFIVAGLCIRFYKLATLSTWPDPDESLFATDAIHISRFWDWHFFYAYSQACFPFPWLLALWFKLCRPSPGSLWLLTSLLSALTVPLFYLTARSFFSKGFSVVLTVFGALAYWSLYAGRIGNTTILVPLIELPALGLFGLILKSKPSQQTTVKAGLLGLCLALGFYIYPPAWAPLALAFFVLVWTQLRKNSFSILPFTSAFLVGFLPFIFFAFREHYGSYIASVKGPDFSFLNFSQFPVSASYVTGLFWGKMDGDYYGPYWGGLFDPLTSSLCFMGIRSAWNNRRNLACKWIGAAVVLSLLPGIFSSNLEFFRVFLVFPFILLLAAWGCQGLALHLQPRQRTWFLGLVFTGIASLNFFHLLGPYQRHWESPGPSWSFYKSPESARAFSLLEQTVHRQGPGYLFQNFPSDMADQSLTLASYPFNLALNPRAGATPAQWFAVLANNNYGPFLLRRFAGGQWFQLSGDLSRRDGGLGLGIFPIHSLSPSTLKAWLEANAAFGEAAYVFLNRPTGTDYSCPLEALERFHPLMQEDPFLESCFWEKAYYLFLQNSAFGDKQKEVNFEYAFQALQQALRHGYPAAHLLNEYGTCLMLKGQFPQAEKTFEKAIRANPSFSPAAANLEFLRGRLHRTSQPPAKTSRKTYGFAPSSLLY